MDGILESGIMDNIEGEFTIKDKGKLITYNRIGDIPDEFDHLIKFKPKFIEPPHTLTDHMHMMQHGNYLNELMKREKK